MLMRVVPGARGSQTYLAVVGFWRDSMMSRRLGGWQRRTLLVMMHIFSKLVVAHRWNLLMAILDSGTKPRCMRARSPWGPPRVFWIVSLAPHTHWMIDGVRASDPRRRREQWVSAQARAWWSSLIPLWITGEGWWLWYSQQLACWQMSGCFVCVFHFLCPCCCW